MAALKIFFKIILHQLIEIFPKRKMIFLDDREKEIVRREENERRTFNIERPTSKIEEERFFFFPVQR
jgi:RNase adaptor protein for sRNA GlmZ degradation